MAMHPVLRGTLRVDTEFKCIGIDRHVTKVVGHVVWYTRSPTNPGEFVVWADSTRKWYVKLPAIQLLDVVQTKP